MKTLDNIMDEFDGTKDCIYLDTACHGLVSKNVLKKILEAMDFYANSRSCSATFDTVELFKTREDAREQLSRLINAEKSEIALIENTTHGMNIIANAILMQRGDEILIPDMEFFGIALPWQLKSIREGVVLKPIPARDGTFIPEDIEDRITAKTKAVIISSVQESNGFRCDLEGISEVCRKNGVYLIVDGIQHIGAIELDVKKVKIDFLVCGGHKWLMAPFGMGFMYVRKELMENLRCDNLGYLSIEVPEGGWENYLEKKEKTPFDTHPPLKDARKFEIGGNPNVLGSLCLYESVKIINELGIEKVSKNILDNSLYLTKALESSGYKVTSPPIKKNMSGIVVFEVSNKFDKNRQVKNELQKNKVKVSLRYNNGIGGIRVSHHIYNGRKDIDDFLNVLNIIGSRD